jgi:hypothetical protein
MNGFDAPVDFAERTRTASGGVFMPLTGRLRKAKTPAGKALFSAFVKKNLLFYQTPSDGK